jgi:outer membrane protein TolC
MKPQPKGMTFPEMLAAIPKTKEELIRIAQQRNPTLLNAVYIEKVAKYLTAEQQGKLLPTISVNGGAQRNLKDGSRRYVSPDRSNTYSATVQMNIPIYQQGSEWSSIRQSYQGEVKARFDREQARKAVIEQAIQAWESWIIANKQIEQFKTQIKAATVTRDSAVLELEVGEGTKLTVLDAQTKLLDAQRGLEQARHDALVAAYQILSLMGMLTTKDLGLSVERYNIDGYYEEVESAFFGTGPSSH